MNPPPPPAQDRGALWVWLQTPLLLALVVAGPLAPGAWHAPAGITLGALLFAGAAGLGIPAVWHLGRNRTPFPRPREGSQLVTRGAYRWVRHPLYVSVLLAAAGWTLLFQSAWAGGISFLCAAFFDAKARREERYLADAFPGYAAYARRVRRFIPGLY